MSLGEKIIAAIERRRLKKKLHAGGAVGDFYRNGGNQLLYDLPVSTGDVVIDGGGYEGEWTEKMLARYGCRSEIFEAIPLFASQLEEAFAKNRLVNVHGAALGGSCRTSIFNLAADGSSEHKKQDVESIAVNVIDISEFVDSLPDEKISCLKLNIEGGEYEVLERLIENKQINKFECFLVQFHRQPLGYEERYKKIVEALRNTHEQQWCYPMVWEKWVIRDEDMSRRV